MTDRDAGPGHGHERGHGRGHGRGETCLVIHPEIRRKGAAAAAGRLAQSRLEEISGLARAIDLVVVHAEIAPSNRVHPATYLGKGTVKRFEQLTTGGPDGEAGSPVDVVIIDAQLSPAQQRNLERALKAKVIDRTGLILEIFGSRARTREGRLQVELAALTYQRSRLVRSWTHLERQRGGAGFMGGPGETQIEADRRLLDQRLSKLKRQLEAVRRTRALHRRRRRRGPTPVVALVGYTNAGKSSLFNKLTGSDVTARDQLFATLDPTMRRLDLPSRRPCILSDTVGFVSDLPHELVDAFHATLEEVLEADLIVHVRDIAHPDTAAQRADVVHVLEQLGLGGDGEQQMIEVCNKIDLLEEAERQGMQNRAALADPPMVALSAVTGEGTDHLLQAIDLWIGHDTRTIEARLAPGDGGDIAWLYRNGQVVDRTETDDLVVLRVRLDAKARAQFAKRRGLGLSAGLGLTT